MSTIEYPRALILSYRNIFPKPPPRKRTRTFLIFFNIEATGILDFFTGRVEKKKSSGKGSSHFRTLASFSPSSKRTCSFPAYGLPKIFISSVRVMSLVVRDPTSTCYLLSHATTYFPERHPLFVPPFVHSKVAGFIVFKRLANTKRVTRLDCSSLQDLFTELSTRLHLPYTSVSFQP